MSGPRTLLLRSTSFLVATGCPHGAVPRRVELPIEEYQEGERRFVRAYLPGADPDRDIQVNLRGSALGLRCERRVEYPDCDRTAPHHVTFDKVVSVPAGTTPDDVDSGVWRRGPAGVVAQGPVLGAAHVSSHAVRAAGRMTAARGPPQAAGRAGACAPAGGPCTSWRRSTSGRSRSSGSPRSCPTTGERGLPPRPSGRVPRSATGWCGT